ncbi:hypothetical protein M011DRAFT_504408 [Sporormia fimetaria CBS 119925]|uniref:Uncharacterized protein n=1 Tax=Sporormia fimetaria CBS 119925 TaxID=1340428 RepID=A0A6A6V6F3_9PLEO|nr:hypothetical protein M011DRAFT_504408 [Sporormia fimetaria CBS 119925]
MAPTATMKPPPNPNPNPKPKPKPTISTSTLFHRCPLPTSTKPKNATSPNSVSTTLPSNAALTDKPTTPMPTPTHPLTSEFHSTYSSRPLSPLHPKPLTLTPTDATTTYRTTIYTSAVAEIQKTHTSLLSSLSTLSTLLPLSTSENPETQNEYLYAELGATKLLDKGKKQKHSIGEQLRRLERDVSYARGEMERLVRERVEVEREIRGLVSGMGSAEEGLEEESLFVRSEDGGEGKNVRFEGGAKLVPGIPVDAVKALEARIRMLGEEEVEEVQALEDEERRWHERKMKQFVEVWGDE